MGGKELELVVVVVVVGVERVGEAIDGRED